MKVSEEIMEKLKELFWSLPKDVRNGLPEESYEGMLEVFRGSDELKLLKGKEDAVPEVGVIRAFAEFLKSHLSRGIYGDLEADLSMERDHNLRVFDLYVNKHGLSKKEKDVLADKLAGYLVLGVLKLDEGIIDKERG